MNYCLKIVLRSPNACAAARRRFSLRSHTSSPPVPLHTPPILASVVLDRTTTTGTTSSSYFGPPPPNPRPAAYSTTLHQCQTHRALRKGIRKPAQPRLHCGARCTPLCPAGWPWRAAWTPGPPPGPAPAPAAAAAFMAATCVGTACGKCPLGWAPVALLAASAVGRAVAGPVHAGGYGCGVTTVVRKVGATGTGHA